MKLQGSSCLTFTNTPASEKCWTMRKSLKRWCWGLTEIETERKIYPLSPGHQSKVKFIQDQKPRFEWLFIRPSKTRIGRFRSQWLFHLNYQPLGRNFLLSDAFCHNFIGSSASHPPEHPIDLLFSHASMKVSQIPHTLFPYLIYFLDELATSAITHTLHIFISWFSSFQL